MHFDINLVRISHDPRNGQELTREDRNVELNRLYPRDMKGSLYPIRKADPTGR